MSATPPRRPPSIVATEGGGDATEPMRATALAGAAGVGEEEDAIPMLTDVVPLQRYASVRLPQSVQGLDWVGLEYRVREYVTQQLTGTANALLEARMSELMSTMLTRHFDALKSELHLMLAQSLREVITEAVHAELTALQEEIKRKR